MSAPNAFEAVRPRGAAIAPTVAPTPRRPGRAPGLLPGSTPRTLVLDTQGRRRVALAPSSNGAFLIESGPAAEAAVLKRQAIHRGGI